MQCQLDLLQPCLRTSRHLDQMHSGNYLVHYCVLSTKYSRSRYNVNKQDCFACSLLRYRATDFLRVFVSFFSVRNGDPNLSYHPQLWSWKVKWHGKQLQQKNISQPDLTVDKCLHPDNPVCLCQGKTYRLAKKRPIAKTVPPYSDLPSNEHSDTIPSIRKPIKSTGCKIVKNEGKNPLNICWSFSFIPWCWSKSKYRRLEIRF